MQSLNLAETNGVNLVHDYMLLPISSKSSNGANSASGRAGEEVKKGKSSEFHPRNNEQVKSSPTLKVWSHGGSYLYPNMAKTGALHGTKKCFLKLG